jgi:hypothetical protein
MNTEKEFSSESISVVNQVARLMEKQKISWTLLRENYSALSNVETKSFWFDGFEIKAQYNPARIISSSADVAKEAIEKRPCFLCERNLPAEQISLRLNDFFVLCNPYPIFREHYTIAKANHNPQSILDNFDELLNISQMFGEKYTILYNGPECGASAPDHMHFQAAAQHVIPIEELLANKDYKCSKEEIGFGSTKIFFVRDDLRMFILFSSNKKDELVSSFNKFYSSYKTVVSADNEPMMNIICWFRENNWSVVIFPRRAHRPKQFFETGEKRLLISPAVVDLGGLLILPREEDFIKLIPENIQDIFRQVIVSNDVFQDLFYALKIVDPRLEN